VAAAREKKNRRRSAESLAGVTDAPALVIEPPAFLRERRVGKVLEALLGARVVGGAVRDAVAGLPVADTDVAAPQQPEEMTRRLEAAGFRVVPTGIAHGTVTAIADGTPVEVTTLRRDVETDGRHAVVEFMEDFRADAARRDFTINAMSMDAHGAVFDYFGGIADLRAGALRFVGDPATRIAEDYLRILRFFRFYARYARRKPDAQTLTALRDGVPGLGRLSAERVWAELKRILAAPDPSGSVTLMAELGVLQAVLPEGADAARLARVVRPGAPADPLLRFAALVTGDIAAVSERLKLSGEETQKVVALQQGAVVPRPDDDDAMLRRILAENDKSVLIGRSWISGGDAPGWRELRDRLAGIAVPVFPLQGRDVVALGVAPGPRVGALLQKVRAAWLAGGCVADRAACLGELVRLLSSDGYSG
jgi:poly(A) polymerase